MPRLSSDAALASGEGRLGDTGCWRLRSPEDAFLKDMSFRLEAPGLTTTYVTSRSVVPLMPDVLGSVSSVAESGALTSCGFVCCVWCHADEQWGCLCACVCMWICMVCTVSAVYM